MPDMGKHYKK